MTFFFLCFVKWKMSIWHLFDGIACSVEYQMCFIYLIFVFEQNFYYKNVILNFVVIYNAIVHGLCVHIQQECVWIKYGSLIFCYVEHLFFLHMINGIEHDFYIHLGYMKCSNKSFIVYHSKYRGKKIMIKKSVTLDILITIF